MSRGIHTLTPDRAWRLSKKTGLHCDGGGLYLRVTPPSASSWAFRYMLDGKRREMGLGAYPDVSLDSARDLARDARMLKAVGKDPLEIRNAVRASQRLEAAKAITFRECAAAYIEAHGDTWKNEKHRAQWSATLETYAYPVLGELPVAAVDRTPVVKVLEPIWKVKPETASRVRGRVEAVLDWATARDYRSGDNPARWKGSLEKLFPARSRVRQVKHHAALPWRDLPAFVARLKAEKGDAAQALLFTIYTAARTGETIAMQGPELDLEAAEWTVPAERMKGKRQHHVPLSDAALTLLRGRLKATGGQGYVFPGLDPRKPISNMAMLQLLRRMGRGDLTVHGFRSTFRDWVEECTAFAGSVAEAALAHVVGDKVEAAYRRGDLFEKRRQLMEAWAIYCTAPPSDAKVLPIRGRARELA